jgi:hypothetical protein
LDKRRKHKRQRAEQFQGIQERAHHQGGGIHVKYRVVPGRGRDKVGRERQDASNRYQTAGIKFKGVVL